MTDSIAVEEFAVRGGLSENRSVPFTISCTLSIRLAPAGLQAAAWFIACMAEYLPLPDDSIRDVGADPHSRARCSRIDSSTIRISSRIATDTLLGYVAGRWGDRVSATYCERRSRRQTRCYSAAFVSPATADEGMADAPGDRLPRL